MKIEVVTADADGLLTPFARLVFTPETLGDLGQLRRAATALREAALPVLSETTGNPDPPTYEVIVKQ